MNYTRCGQVLIIFLFIMVSIGFCFAEVEIRVWNEKTKKFETLEMTPELREKMERQEALRRSQKKSDDSQAIQKPEKIYGPRGAEQAVSPPTVRKSTS